MSTSPLHQTPIHDIADLDRRLRRLEDLRATEDVLLRFAAGQDRSDRVLFASAFHAQAVLDFVQPAALFGVTLAPFAGKSSIVDTVFHNISAVRTSHTVTNQRIEIGGDHARGTALVEAQHVLKADPKRQLLLKNFYDVELVRAGAGWEATRMVIRNIWYSGEPTVLFPG